MSAPVTGLISLQLGGRHYSLLFPQHGWLAAELVQYLGDVLRAADAEVAVVKLLGYTLTISAEPPPRRSDHWVEIDLKGRELVTNSGLIRKAIDQDPVEEGEPFSGLALRRIYEVLDEFDFTVKLMK